MMFKNFLVNFLKTRNFGMARFLLKKTPFVSPISFVVAKRNILFCMLHGCFGF